MDVKLKPDPLVSYRTDKTVKTECKPIEEVRQQLIDTEKIKSCNNDETVENDGNIKSKSIETEKAQSINKILHESTPLTAIVIKQQNEIESLKTQLYELRIENERLKSKSISTLNSNFNSSSNSMTDTNTNPNSNSISPQYEEKQDSTTKNSISFNESVDVLHDDNDSDSVTNIKLNDKASIVRSSRNSTPYKIKPKPFKSKRISHPTISSMKENQENTKENQENIIPNAPYKQSRSSYRITPIPRMGGRKKIIFNSRLQRIKDNSEIPKNCDAVKNSKNNTNNNNGSMGPSSKESSLDLSFALGPASTTTSSTTPSSAASFLKGGVSSNNSSFAESTLDINHLSLDITKTPNSSSFVSPILTPNANSKKQNNPFVFSWNKKK